MTNRCDFVGHFRPCPASPNTKLFLTQPNLVLTQLDRIPKNLWNGLTRHHDIGVASQVVKVPQVLHMRLAPRLLLFPAPLIRGLIAVHAQVKLFDVFLLTQRGRRVVCHDTAVL